MELSWVSPGEHRASKGAPPPCAQGGLTSTEVHALSRHLGMPKTAFARKGLLEASPGGLPPPR
eukprot:964348-Alexandrium_andersonii.AAC.1